MICEAIIDFSKLKWKKSAKTLILKFIQLINIRILIKHALVFETINNKHYHLHSFRSVVSCGILPFQPLHPAFVETPLIVYTSL